jgi:aryl-alcohol dehydrogenase-like predicted oxidoreductase
VRAKPFGRTGLTVSSIGIGCSRLGGTFSSTSGSEETDLVRAALDAGVNFFDTSDMYSHGQSEVLLGRALRGRRSEAIIATKAGYVVPSSSRLVGRIKPLVRPLVRAVKASRVRPSPGPAATVAQDFSPEYLAAAAEASLRRLGTDYIDIFQLHSPPRSVVDAGEFVGVFEQLKAQGKIRHYGIAADKAEDLIAAPGLASVESLQMPFSAINHAAASGVLTAAAANGVGAISRSCYAAGLLVGPLSDSDLRARTPDAEAIIRFRRAAARLARPLKELALQFNLGVDEIAVTVLGMVRREQLEENVRFAAAPPLTFDEWTELGEAELAEPES